MFSKNNIATVLATNISNQKGTTKNDVKKVTIDQLGVINDAHRGPGHRQVSLLSGISIDAFSKKTGKKFPHGAFGENITFRGIDYKNISLLDKLKINNTVLEITQIGKKCHGDMCSIYREVGKCIMPQEGFFSRVIEGGKVKVGDNIEHQPYTLKLLIITMSDRVKSGIYNDQSGKIARETLDDFFQNSSWRFQIEQIVFPDEAKLLKSCLQKAIKNNTDIIFTLGGTGVGERDITPETVSEICNKFLTRIMDNISLKHAAIHPAALLSRSIAGITKKTQIYTLPGNAKAVNEYLIEIFKVLEHVIFTLHGIDKH